MIKGKKMNGKVDIQEFFGFMKKNKLVISPAHLVIKEITGKEVLKNKTLKKKALTYREISDCELWGAITQKRCYLIAKEKAKPLETFRCNNKSNSPEKILTTAVIRIGKQRGTL